MEIQKHHNGRKKRVGWQFHLTYLPPNGVKAIKEFCRKWKAEHIEHWYKDEVITSDKAPKETERA